MAIKDTIYLLAHSTDANNRREWAVLYWRSRGLGRVEVADKLGYSPIWVGLYMNRIFKRFNAPPGDRYEKLRWLQENVFPAVAEFVQGEPESVKAFPPPDPNRPEPDEPEETPDAPQETVEGEPVDEEQANPPSPPPHTDTVININPKRLTGPAPLRRSACLPIVISLFALAVVAYIVFRPHSPTAPATPTVTVTTPQNTQLPSATPEVATTQAPQATSEPPTVAATATIPALTNTLPAFYDQGVYAPLENGFIKLDEAFNDEHLACTPPDPGFEVSFTFQTSQPIFLRYDPTGFSATDDTGKAYDLKGAGITICNAVGPQALQVYYGQELRLKFAGVIPQAATDIVITAQLNGQKFVFHKSL